MSRRGDVLFIDEIHRLSPTIEEILYPGDGGLSARPFDRGGADGAIDSIGSAALYARWGNDAGGIVDVTLARPIRLVGPSRIIIPSRNSSGSWRGSGGLLGLALEPKAAHEIARRARGTPRIANRLLRRVRDFASVRDGDATRIKLDTTCFALERLDVDEAGFDGLDRSFLKAIIEKFSGGPVGLDTLAAAVGEDKGTLEDVVEPYLIHCGFLARTPRGRVATSHAYAHLGLPTSAAPVLR